MTSTFGPTKNSEYFQPDPRSSFGKLLDANSNNVTLHDNNVSQSSRISFQNFRLNVPPSHANVKLKGSASMKPGQFLQEITNSLPKISARGTARNELAVTHSPKSKTIKGGGTDSQYHSLGNNTLKHNYLSQSQKSLLSYDNKSIADIMGQADVSGSNNYFFNKEYATSGANSPKKSIVFTQKKLPLKRRALNKDLKDAYRTIINSKDHGSFRDLTQTESEREYPAPVLPKKINIKTSIRNHVSAKELEQIERDKEEQKLVEELKEKSMKDFRRKIDLYNFIKANYLVDPEAGDEDRPKVGHRRKIISPVKAKDESKKDLLATLQKNFVFPALANPSMEKLTLEKVKTNTRNQQEGLNDDNSLEEKMGPGGIPQWKRDEEEMLKKREIMFEEDLKKMKALEDMLSNQKKLSDNEQLVFKFVKDGNDMELGHLLARFNELVKAEDSRKETPLHWAVKRGYYSIVVCLCKNGADICATDLAGRKPIDIAQRLKRTEIIEYLRTLHKRREIDLRFQ